MIWNQVDKYEDKVLYFSQFEEKENEIDEKRKNL